MPGREGGYIYGNHRTGQFWPQPQIGPTGERIVMLPNGWKPRPYQKPLWKALQGGCKRAMAIWHRRAGKDDVCLHYAAVAVHTRPATYWHMLPKYSQARKAIWAAINPHTGKRRIDEAFPHDLRETTNEQNMFIRFKNGGTWQVVGSDKHDDAVGAPPAGIVFSEWALSNPSTWGYLAPILVENDGWAIFITTSRGRNHAKQMLDMARETPGWYAEVLTVNDTNAIDPRIVEEQRKEYHGIFGEEAGDALIEQEYYCSFDAAILGAYYGKEIATAEREGRVCKVPVDPNWPVHTAWDLGMDDAMAIWCFQVAPGRVNVVDYYEGHGHGFDHYYDWLAERGYRGEPNTRTCIDWVPHDARVRELGVPGGRTRLESMLLLGRPLGRVPRIMPQHVPMDRIAAARKTIPVCWFDAERCAQGLNCLREYKSEWDQSSRVFSMTPLHNWASHGADSFGGLSIAWREPQGDETPKQKTPAEIAKELTRPRTMAELFDDDDEEYRL